jgi:hypothetical protein
MSIDASAVGITLCSALEPNNSLSHSRGLIQANPDRFKAGNDRNARLRWTPSRTGALDEGCAGAMPTNSEISMATDRQHIQPVWPPGATSPFATDRACGRFAVADQSGTLSRAEDDALPHNPCARLTAGRGFARCQHL